jgi:hypothetical protein
MEGIVLKVSNRRHPFPYFPNKQTEMTGWDFFCAVVPEFLKLALIFSKKNTHNHFSFLFFPLSLQPFSGKRSGYFKLFCKS